MSNTDIKACPVFTRWQVKCVECGTIFYVDTEPWKSIDNIQGMDDIKCGNHPQEDSIISIV